MDKELIKELMEDILSRYNNEEYWSRDIIEAYEQKKRFADIVIPVYYAKDDNGKITIDEEEMTNDFEIELAKKVSGKTKPII